MGTPLRRPCLGTTAPCPRLASPGKTRCTQCERERWRTQGRTRGTRAHYTGPWPTLSRVARAHHLQRHGPLCPGYRRPAHTVPAHTLTVDHIQPRSLTAGIRVLCQGCNAARRERADETIEQLELDTIIVIDELRVPLMH